MRILLLLACCLPAFCGACEELARLSLPHTTISAAVSVPAGAFTPPSGPPLKDLPAFCRVVLVLAPTTDSHVEAEVWMPASGWNGKFQGVGNGGFAGSIAYAGLGIVLSRRYAAAASDTGHRAAAGTDASWALGHPEKIVDFGYRAVHETAVTAKALIKAFYGEGPRRSYFSSCSNGGRQALMEAQRYPGDYDGIIAGAPANDWTHLLSAAIWHQQALTLDPASYISPKKLPAIQAAALAACDANDGVKDGVIENPPNCRFDPGTLLCQGADSDSCLTAPQVAALHKIYAGPKTAKGKTITPGYSPGAEAGQGGWAAWIVGPEPTKSLMFAFGSNFYKNMVYNDANWDYKTFELERDTRLADDKMAPILSAVNPDLKKFKERGGKLIMYHGWNDAAIPGQSSVNYYQSVVEKMGPKSVAEFARLYMVPGMQHCGGGDGPNAFGQLGPGAGDARHDVGKALEHWVETGIAPDAIIATRYKTGANPASGVARTRPLCAYPKTAQWKGSGSTDDDANFVCK